MKKIILILAAALCTANAAAQRLQLKESTVHTPTTKLSVVQKASARRITPATRTIISQQPEGTLLTDMTWTSTAGTPNNNTHTLEWMELSGFVPTIVVNGNKMYICSPITQFADYATPWIEGTITGETVTFRTPQAYYNFNGTMLYATRLNAQTAKMEEGNMNITFSYKDGNLKQTDGGILALTDINGGFYGYAEANIEVSKISDETVKLPDGAELKSYTLSFSGNQKQTAKVAFVGKDVYISDPVGIEDAWMKGTLEGNTISIPTKQYLGSGSGYPLYVQSAQKYTYPETNMMGQIENKIGYKLLDDTSINFTYDAATGSFSTSQMLLINAGKNDLGPAYVAYENASYEPWTQVKATPANPSISQFIDLTPFNMKGFSGSMLSYTVPTVDINGEFIAQEDIYYQLTFDGKPIELYGQTMIPYYGSVQDADQGLYLSVSGDVHQLQHPDVIKNTVSIQSFYVVNGETSASDIVTYNIVDGELVQTDAIEDVLATAPGKTSTTAFNLAGQRVANGYKGIVVKGGKKFLNK